MTNQRPSSLGPIMIITMVGAAVLLLTLITVGVTAAVLPGCSGCHFKDARFKDATLKTAHRQIACSSCHVDKGSVVNRTKFGMYQVFGMWLRFLDPGASDVAAARDEGCLSCHRDINNDVVEAKGFRIKHANCALGRTCVDCHSNTGHGRATRWPTESAMNDCVTCHRRTKNPLTCKTCHTGRIQRTVFTKPVFSVTHGPKWRTVHGMGPMESCSLCHQEGDCGRCHGPGVPHNATFIQDHPAVAISPKAKCGMCHVRATFCDGCHGTRMPHPRTFPSQHPKLVKSRGERPCLRCHAVEDCDKCHERHVHPGGAVGNIPRPKRGER